MEDVCLPIKAQGCEEPRSSSSLPNLFSLMKAFVSEREEELEAQHPYLYSNLLHRNPHCQAHKRFIEQRESKVVLKTGQEVPTAMQKRADGRKKYISLGESHDGSY